ncbi:hypothetical protein [Mycoplasmopsis adleri]|uniref:hypothetical protein n=1 Tax=Mycoplasmopsis adleri TaxID=51362 RepID=UPI0038738D9C
MLSVDDELKKITPHGGLWSPTRRLIYKNKDIDIDVTVNRLTNAFYIALNDKFIKL